MKVKNVVLGAGIAGLACANELRKEKEDYIVFEKENFYGGLCHSFDVNGFTFDSAVHLSFTEDEKAREFFDSTQHRKHQPVSYNYYSSLWLKHPILNNLYPISADIKVDLVQSFIERKTDRSILNYGDWLRGSYGDIIAEKFYYPYTRKYWTEEPEELSTNWIGKRLNSPDIRKLLYGAFTDNTGNDYYAKEMRYPTGSGGYATYLKPLAEGLNIMFNKEMVVLNLDEKYVEFKDHTICHYDNLFSSIPLPLLAQKAIDVSQEIKDKADCLKASQVSLVSIGFNKSDIAKWLWFYIYDEDILSARVNSPSMKSKENAKEGDSLQFEIYHKPGEKVDKERIISNTKYALEKMNICKKEDILFMDYRLLQYGNVIFNNGMEENRDAVKHFFGEKGVELIGRFGEWDYLWSDQSYLSGLNAARKKIMKDK